MANTLIVRLVFDEPSPAVLDIILHPEAGNGNTL